MSRECVLMPASVLQGVDPAVYATCRPRQDARIAQGVGQERAAFVGSQQVEGKIVFGARQRASISARVALIWRACTSMTAAMTSSLGLEVVVDVPDW